MNYSLKNPMIIHIISEITIILSLIVYFNRKISCLTENIKNITNRLTKQDQILNNHEQILLKLLSNNKTLNLTSNPKKPKGILQKPRVSFNLANNTHKSILKHNNEEFLEQNTCQHEDSSQYHDEAEEEEMEKIEELEREEDDLELCDDNLIEDELNELLINTNLNTDLKKT